MCTWKKHGRWWTPLSCCCLLFSFEVNAGLVKSWQSCVDDAVKNNAELKSALENLKSTEYSEKAAYSGFLPTVSAGLGYTKEGTASDQPTSKSYNFSLTASQNLFSGLQDLAKVKQAKGKTQIGLANLQTAKAQLGYDLKNAYAQLVFAQQSVKLQEDISKRRKDNLKLVELRFESGRENKGAVLLSKAYLNQAHYDVLQSKNKIQTAKSKLARVIGMDGDLELDFIVDEHMPENEAPLNPNFMALAAITPEHLQYEAQENISNAELSIAESNFSPSLDLTGTKSKQGSEWFPENKHWSVGLNLKIPLFNGGKDFYGTKSALASVVAAKEKKISVDRESVTALKEKYMAYIEAIEKLKVDESFLEAGMVRANIARNKYNNGLMTFDDWDIIENDLISRQTSVLQGQRDRVLAEAAWEQAQGKGVIP